MNRLCDIIPTFLYVIPHSLSSSSLNNIYYYDHDLVWDTWVLSQKQKVRETSTPPLPPSPGLAVRLCSGVISQHCTPSHPSHQSRASKTFSHWSRTLTGWLRHTCHTWERGRVPSRSNNKSVIYYYLLPPSSTDRK